MQPFLFRSDPDFRSSQSATASLSSTLPRISSASGFFYGSWAAPPLKSQADHQPAKQKLPPSACPNDRPLLYGFPILQPIGRLKPKAGV